MTVIIRIKIGTIICFVIIIENSSLNNDIPIKNNNNIETSKAPLYKLNGFDNFHNSINPVIAVETIHKLTYSPV